ncbi:hypothetical protein HDU89_002482 [Geranomyces variabilis]|nr:hypothetical protein HDU89_002482 [Geranomyces variabilis]
MARDVNIHRAIEGALAFICSSTVVACLFIPKFLVIRSGHGDDEAKTFEGTAKNASPTRSAESNKIGEVLAVYREEYKALLLKAAQAGVQLPPSDNIKQAEDKLALESKRASLTPGAGAKLTAANQKRETKILATHTDNDSEV